MVNLSSSDAEVSSSLQYSWNKSAAVGRESPTFRLSHHRLPVTFLDCVKKAKRSKGSQWMVVVDGQVIPQGSRVLEASPAEVTLVEHTLNVAAPQQRHKSLGSSLTGRMTAPG